MHELINRFLLLSIFLICTSCSQEAWYKGSKSSHDIRCLQQSNSDYDDCINEQSPDYDEYKQAKDQLKKTVKE